MKLINSIGWCDQTTNAVTGCAKVSPGCRDCYAESGTRARVLRAQGIETWGPKGVRHPVNFEAVFKRLNKLSVCGKCAKGWPHDHVGEVCRKVDIGRDSKCEGIIRRIRLFADSNSDWLDEQWPIETLARFLDAIRLAPNVDVLLLTKRIDKWQRRMRAVETIRGDETWLMVRNWIDGDPPLHVHLGVSVENQEWADKRREDFRNVPAAVKFASYEPMIGFVDWSGWQFVNQIIAGGLSGKNWKRFQPDLLWFTLTRDFCAANDIAFWCKQDASFKSGQQGRLSDETWKIKEASIWKAASKTVAEKLTRHANT